MEAGVGGLRGEALGRKEDVDVEEGVRRRSVAIPKDNEAAQ